MKGSENFKKVIENYLRMKASKDPLIAKNLEKDGKNIDDCITYILTFVQKSGRNGFTDDEVYGIALHYYDEDDIDIKNLRTFKNTGSVIVNHVVELTDEEKEKARETAIRELVEESKNKLRKKTVTGGNDNVQPTLF